MGNHLSTARCPMWARVHRGKFSGKSLQKRETRINAVVSENLTFSGRFQKALTAPGVATRRGRVGGGEI